MAAQKGVETTKGKVAPFGNGKKELDDSSSQDHKKTESGKERAGKETSTADWRKKQDRIEIYNMQKYLT